MDEDEWESFKQFVQSDTVQNPHGPFLPLLLRFYEYGLNNEVPPEWQDYLNLMKFRNNKIFAKALALERKVGKVKVQLEEAVEDQIPKKNNKRKRK